MIYKLFTYSICFGLLSILLTGCDNSPKTPSEPQYTETASDSTKITHRFAIHPLHNPTKLSEAYQPLIDYLNHKIEDTHFELEASRDYQAYENKLRNDQPHWILPNPWQTLLAIDANYNVIAMAGDAKDFKGIFIVRRDSDIEQPEDLKGGVVSYPSYTALAACIMPQQYLHDNGINVTNDIKNHYVGSQESSIMNVFLKESIAGATWPPPWRLFQQDHPDKAKQLKVIWETPSLINNSVMARGDVPQQLVDKVKNLLYTLHTTDAGVAILNQMSTSRFFPANNDSYKPAQDFITHFEQTVRPVEIPQ